MTQIDNSGSAASKQSSEPLFPSGRAFIVQFVREAADEGIAHETYRGRVEHVISGRSSRFATVDDLVTFMRQVLEDSSSAAKIDS